MLAAASIQAPLRRPAQVVEHGLEGLRIREIARAASINHATLLHHFASKIESSSAWWNTCSCGCQYPSLAAARRYRAGPRLDHELDDLAARIAGDRKLFIVLTEVQLRAARDPVVTTALARLDAGWHAHLLSIVRSGIQRGELRGDLDADRSASVLAVLFRGLGLEAVYHDEGSVGPLIDRARVIDEARVLLARWLYS